MEHHSNIVPWQMLCERTGAVLKSFLWIKRELIMAEYDKLLEKTKIVATIHISNALVHQPNPSTWLIKHTPMEQAVLIDGAQAVPI
jgi:cysteine desulfurase/selenocysteine lyase